MIPSTREGEDFQSDELDKDYNGAGPSSNIAKADSASSSAWLRSKDPRIVRVSRAFGGKDRHSKVCTIRGLRDRRVRLSVPTAIQLYDLQDRLGLNQPSKVVDWLLNVAKDDIDELPPLHIPPGFNFIDQAHQAMLSSSSHAANQQVGTTSTLQTDQELSTKINANWEMDNAPINLHKSCFWTSPQPRSTKIKNAIGTNEVEMSEKEMWTKGVNNDHEDDHKLEILELAHGGGGGMQLGSSSSYFPRSSNQSSLPNFLHNVSPYGSYYHLDYPSNFPLSSSSSQSEDHHNHYNVIPIQSASLSLPSGPHVLLCPRAMASQSHFPSHVATAAAPMELDPRQLINHFQILNPADQQQSSLQMSLDALNKKR